MNEKEKNSGISEKQAYLNIEPRCNGRGLCLALEIPQNCNTKALSEMIAQTSEGNYSSGYVTSEPPPGSVVLKKHFIFLEKKKRW